LTGEEEEFASKKKGQRFKIFLLGKGIFGCKIELFDFKTYLNVVFFFKYRRLPNYFPQFPLV